MVGLAPKDKGNPPAPIIPGLKMKGDTIAGRYRVERLLGAGSSGFVVAARHVYLRRRVTLKILTATTSAHQRAQRRHLAVAHQAAALRGPHVAQVVDTGFTEEGTPFIATERLEGRTLAEELSSRTRLPPVEAVRWILQACEGLAEAHSAGIVHGDLKPQNLFLAGDANAASTDHGGESRVLKVLDFGMATPVDADGDEGTAAWFASPAYLAPEQIRDPAAVDVRTDVWALGVILYELIAGTLPFASDTVSGMLVAVSHDEPALLTAQDVPFELARIVQSCLAKDPSGRSADVATLALALAPFAGQEGIALARRVESALSAPPPTPTRDASGEPKPDAAAPAGASPRPSSKAARRAKPRGVVATDQVRALLGHLLGARPDSAFRRRQLGAIATVGAAAVLAVVGLLVSPAPPATSTTTTSAATVERHTTMDLGEVPPRTQQAAPLPFIPPSFRVEEEPETTVPAPAPPPSAPAPPPPAPPRTTERPAVVGALHHRLPPRAVPRPVPGAVKEAPIVRSGASLSVRENPYGRGFTHPTRLSERRK